MGIDQIHRFLQRLDAHDTEHGSENFFLVNHHAGLDVVEQARAQEVTFLMACHLDATAIDQQGRTLGHALVDIALDLLKMRFGDQRPHIALGIEARAHGHLGDLRFETGDHRVGGRVAHCYYQGNCHAALTAGPECSAHQRVDRIGNIGVRHDHSMVLGTAQGLDPLAVLAAFGINVFSNRRGAHEAHRFDARISQQRIHRFFVAVHHVEHAGWQARFKCQFGNAQCAARVALGGLQDEAVATGYCHRPHPQRHHGREVEWRNAGGDAQGLELAPGIDGRAHVFTVFALEQFRCVRGVFHVFDTALQFAHGVAQHLAVFGSNQAAQLVRMLFQQHLQVAHDAGALQWRRVAPGGKGRLCIGNRLLHRGFVGQQNPLLGFASGGVKDVLRAGAGAYGLTANQMANEGKR